MRAVVQRVDRASVTVDEKITGEVQKGLLVLLGVAEGDTDKDLAYIIDKVCGMRIFEDEAGKMNLSVKDVGGAILAVSQFTLCGDCRHGKRPSFTAAAAPDVANAYYERFVEGCRKAGNESGIRECGRRPKHGADLLPCTVIGKKLVELVNNGPVTILLDSTKLL